MYRRKAEIGLLLPLKQIAEQVSPKLTFHLDNRIGGIKPRSVYFIKGMLREARLLR